jgi:Flp pilus assembly protein TadG
MSVAGRGHVRRRLRLLGRDERGVVGVLVGLLIGTVLLGLGALVIDVGQLYTERAQLQNGADAAALAVAKSCILGSCTPSSALSTAQNYANKNAADGVAGVGTVCGYAGTLTACGASTGAMTACPSPPASGTNYVDVNTSTKTSGGTTVIAPVFAKELLGNGSYTGTTVLACAQVQWGSSGRSTYSGILTAFTTTACQWDKAVSQGTVYGTPPPGSLPPSSYDMKLTLGYLNGTGCSTEPAGSDGPGTFGWITETGGCTLNSITGTTYPVRTGTASPNCNTPLFDDAQNKSLIYIPVYTSATGNGASSVYNLKGIAAFVVTGYNVPGGGMFGSYPDWLKSANTCTGNSYCIDGYFVAAAGTLSSSSGVTSMKITG